MEYDFGLSEDETDEKLALTNDEIDALDVALSFGVARMIEEGDDEYASLLGGLQSRVHNRDFVDDE